ncbi:hypothetical protein [Parazoarcus communis]|nr:hypothetical protein [Parazoarcus communis]
MTEIIVVLKLLAALMSATGKWLLTATHLLVELQQVLEVLAHLLGGIR